MLFIVLNNYSSVVGVWLLFKLVFYVRRISIQSFADAGSSNITCLTGVITVKHLAPLPLLFLLPLLVLLPLLPL
jgi:hypothetical protein